MISRTGFFRVVSFCAVVLFSSLRAYAGEMTGRVRLQCPVPAPEIIAIEPKSGDHSTEGCGDQKISQKLMVGKSGGVQNAVVWLEDPGDTRAVLRQSAFILDQKECVFVPHLLILPVESRLMIRNSDSIRHNVRIFQGARMLMHHWQPKGSHDLSFQFSEPGRYVVRCGAHPWMYAWIIVASHPYYALTDAEGKFSIPDIPAGRYVLHVWHETLGERTLPVEVSSSGTHPSEISLPSLGH